MLLSLVVPCYNEAENILPLLDRFQEKLDRNDVELILVDNGSTDQSFEIINHHLDRYPFARLVRVEKNQGYGYGILQGLKSAAGTYVGWTHADLQTDTADALKALHLLESRHEDKPVYLKGSRKHRPMADRLFTAGMSVFETVYLRERMWDINAQPNIFPRDFFLTWRSPPHDFSLDLYAYYTAQKSGLKIIRFPVLFSARKHGLSHWNSGLRSKGKFIMRTLRYSEALKKSSFKKT